MDLDCRSTIHVLDDLWKVSSFGKEAHDKATIETTLLLSLPNNLC